MRIEFAIAIVVGIACGCQSSERSLGEVGGLGAPCEHVPLGAPQNFYGTADQEDCGGEACLYAEERVIPPEPCALDSDCNPVGGPAPFECVVPDGELNGTCLLSPNYVLQRSMCAPACETDADCQDDVGPETACETGFSCAALFTEGSLCCQALCVCNDDLPDTTEADSVCQYPEAVCG